MATIPELLDGQVTLEVENLDRLYPERLHRQTGNRPGVDDVHARSVAETGSLARSARAAGDQEEVLVADK
jgi:hypothetical protein